MRSRGDDEPRKPDICPTGGGPGSVEGAAEDEREHDEPRDRRADRARCRFEYVISIPELATDPDEKACNEQNRVRSAGGNPISECGDENHRVRTIPAAYTSPTEVSKRDSSNSEVPTCYSVGLGLLPYRISDATRARSCCRPFERNSAGNRLRL